MLFLNVWVENNYPFPTEHNIILFLRNRTFLNIYLYIWYTLKPVIIPSVTGDISISAALKHLLLAENSFALSISPSDLRSKLILLVIKNDLL